MLATNESSAAIAANTMSETDSSVNVEVASGLAAPVGSGETSAVKRPTESAVIVSASSPSAQASSLPTAAIDSALADFASEADDTTTEADEDLYSLISDES